ncbi:MAG: hypothetical protein JWL73_2910 [Actinomycetia bacterium]|nr:hypothetical protein [Actinomycetes bacterium]
MIRPIRVLVTVTALVLVVAACSGGSSSKDASGRRTTTTTAGNGTSATTAGPGSTTAGDPSATTTTAAQAVKCKAGLGSLGGVQTRTFCGSATATVTVGTTPLFFHGGRCDTGPGYLTVNIGTVALGALADPAQKPTYFGLVAGDLSKAPGSAAAADPKNPPITGDGAYPGQPIVTGNQGANAIVLKTVALTLSAGQKKGTFSGTALDGQAVTGSFACG